MYKYAIYIHLDICQNMHDKYAQICKNMDFPIENMQKKWNKNMKKNAEKYAIYAEVHFLHFSNIMIYALCTLLMGHVHLLYSKHIA
jgi:hypothetical protein